MRKKLLFLIMLCCSLNLWAAKSAGTPMLVFQPDGKSVTIQLLGDEHFSWYQTTDGVLLVRKKSAYYVAKVNNGALVSTGVLAHDASDRSKKEKNLINAQDKNKFFVQADNSVKTRRKAIAKMDKKEFCPHMGEIHIPIILMNYPNKKFVLGDGDKAELYKVFEEYFNGTEKTPYTDATIFLGYGSISQYFTDASNGKFTPVFDLYGPYETKHEHDYYGSRRDDLVTEAVAKADRDIDFSKYDSNNDGNVDLVYVLYAGTGANLSGNLSDVWPGCTADQYIVTNDHKTVRVIGVSNELATDNYMGQNLRAGIGVFCHEMSHALGLPDLYWTLKDVKPHDANGNPDFDNCGPEDWDLMDGGENIYNGMWPCQYNAWEREYLGWEDAEELTDAQNITLAPRNKGGKAYKITNPADPYECYTIEHTGYDAWNYYLNKLYGNGMLIMHVTSSPDGLGMTPNNVYGHPNVTLVPADGRILSPLTVITNKSVSHGDFNKSMKGDVYPGLQNVTSVAAFKNYEGEDMVNTFPITNIVKNADQTVSFRFMGGEFHIEDGEELVDIPTGQYGKITYTRNYAHTSWNALYVPFEIPYEDICDDFDVAEVIGFSDVDETQNDKGYFAQIHYEYIHSGTIKPNTPYIYKAKTAGKKTITVRDAYLHEAVSSSTDFYSEKRKFTIMGTYTTLGPDVLQDASHTFYGYSKGKLVRPTLDSVLRPCRWIVDISDLNNENNTKGFGTAIIADEEDTITGINGITEQMDSDSQNTIYDVNGRKVSGSTLQHGIYIYNGRKIVK